MNGTTIRAAQLLCTYTGHRFNGFYQLAGASNASARAHIMSELLGRRVPQSQSGITALHAEFFARAGVVSYTCDYDADEQFAAWLRDVVQS